MGSKYEIRRCRLEDEADVVALWTEVLAYQEPHNEPLGRFRRKMAFQPEYFYVAEVGGRVVATAIGGYDGVRGWIYAVAVQADFRGQGIARALIRKVEAELISQGCPKINLFVRPDNLLMATYYESLGYRAEAGIAMSKLPGQDEPPSRRVRRKAPAKSDPPDQEPAP